MIKKLLGFLGFVVVWFWFFCLVWVRFWGFWGFFRGFFCGFACLGFFVVHFGFSFVRSFLIHIAEICILCCFKLNTVLTMHQKHFWSPNSFKIFHRIIQAGRHFRRSPPPNSRSKQGKYLIPGWCSLSVSPETYQNIQ